MHVFFCYVIFTQYLTKRLDGKEVSEMTYFVLGVTVGHKFNSIGWLLD